MRISVLMVVAAAVAGLTVGVASADGFNQRYQECMSSLQVWSARSDVGSAKAQEEARKSQCRMNKRLCGAVQSAQAAVSMAETRLSALEFQCQRQAKGKEKKQVPALGELEQIELSATAWETRNVRSENP